MSDAGARNPWDQQSGREDGCQWDGQAELALGWTPGTGLEPECALSTSWSLDLAAGRNLQEQDVGACVTALTSTRPRGGEGETVRLGQQEGHTRCSEVMLWELREHLMPTPGPSPSLRGPLCREGTLS